MDKRNPKRSQRRGLGDLPEPHAALRGEWPYPRFESRLPPRREASYPAVPTAAPDRLVPGQDVPNIGTSVQSVWDVRPINAVDFYVSGGVVAESPFRTMSLHFAVPQGRVLVLKRISWEISTAGAV